jgi:AmpD protein
MSASAATAGSDLRMPAATRRAAWRDGWWSRAEARLSPNHNERPDALDISLVVLHSISLPPGEYGGDAIERLFTNRLQWDAHPYFESIRDIKVSAHFVIRRPGKLLQFVSCTQRAWHAGSSQWCGRDNCNDYSIGVELEGLEGERFEAAQYKQLTRLLRALARHYKITAVVGHEHVAPTRKHDPGRGFDWGRLRRDLRWSRARVPHAPD